MSDEEALFMDGEGIMPPAADASFLKKAVGMAQIMTKKEGHVRCASCGSERMASKKGDPAKKAATPLPVQGKGKKKGKGQLALTR